MRRFFWILIAVIVLISVMVVAYICYADVDHNGKDTVEEDHTNFSSFCDKIEPDWLRMISSALKTLDYFENHLSDMVTDVAVGTRIMEAQVNILLKAKLDLNQTIQEDLKTLQRKSNLVGDTILQNYLNYADSTSMKDVPRSRMMKNLQWIRNASTWETPAVKQWKTLQSNTDIIPAENVSMATDFGELSDGCIFGTFENCTIPDYCIDFIWREPHSGYLLTHQILFHYMIIQNNCFSGENRDSYEAQNLTEPEQFLETLCRRVLTEAALIESLEYPHGKQDLFVEQILVCSLAGYNDFLTRNWTDIILGWAGDDGTLGCYTTPSTQNLKRVKRWDHFFKLGNVVCSVHMGALILGVIGQQLRYYLEMCYKS